MSRDKTRSSADRRSSTTNRPPANRVQIISMPGTSASQTRGSAGFNKFDNALKQFVDNPATVLSPEQLRHVINEGKLGGGD